jgi:hypothetical protein
VNSDLLLRLIFVSLPFEFFQKRGPHKVGDANEFTSRCALNFEEHGVRYAGLDRIAIGSRKYFTAPALSKGMGLRFSGHRPFLASAAFEKYVTFLENALHPKINGVARGESFPIWGCIPLWGGLAFRFPLALLVHTWELN